MAKTKTPKSKSRRVKSDKPILIPIPDWRHADDMVARIGSRQREIAAAEAKAETAINAIKAKLQGETQPLVDAINLHFRSLESFCAANKKSFGKNRSRKLAFGKVGWHKSTSISIAKKSDKTLTLIKTVLSAALRKTCIIKKESVDKDALAKLTDDQLASIAAQRVNKDVFYVEPLSADAADYRDAQHESSTR